jgi:hypothetical protein
MTQKPFLFVTILMIAIPAAAFGQAFQAPPPMLAPPPAQQNQPPAEYAFRPDLTNPQFGECLQLEKNWKMLWQRYAQEYQRAQMINPRDPNYAQVSYYMRSLKAQLDAAWQNFSSRCVYFPQGR